MTQEELNTKVSLLKDRLMRLSKATSDLRRKNDPGYVSFETNMQIANNSIDLLDNYQISSWILTDKQLRNALEQAISAIHNCSSYIAEPTYNLAIDDYGNKNGLLYNHYAVRDERNLLIDGWHIPSEDDYAALFNYCGGALGGSKISDANTRYWDDINNITNEYKFNARGSGRRQSKTNEFINLRTSFHVWLFDFMSGNQARLFNISHNYLIYSPPGHLTTIRRTDGISVRAVKNTTKLSHGESGLYFGNDGRKYRTICIGNHEWLADNLAETKFRNGDDVPEVTDGAEWAALTTAGMCAYNNDWSNV
jgi:uncharacterized protein (TIGR02145 family)